MYPNATIALYNISLVNITSVGAEIAGQFVCHPLVRERVEVAGQFVCHPLVNSCVKLPRHLPPHMPLLARSLACPSCFSCPSSERSQYPPFPLPSPSSPAGRPSAFPTSSIRAALCLPSPGPVSTPTSPSTAAQAASLSRRCLRRVDPRIAQIVHTVAHIPSRV